VSAARLATLRIVRSRSALVTAGAWLALALGAAIVERSRGWHSAGHVLLGAFGAIALPLLVFTIVGATLAGAGFGRAGRPLVAFGADPLRVAMGTLAVAAIASVVLSGLASAVVAAVAHGADDPPLFRDVLTSAKVGGLAALAYAAFFALGAALFRSGIGRGALLAADWIFGDGTGAGSLLTPRAHLRSLFGGPPAFELSQRASTVALVVLALVFGALALVLARRQRP
jgi:hypothetical protein